MPPSPERISRFAARRRARLEGLPKLAHTDAGGGSRAWFVADELLVVDDSRREVERYLGRARAAQPGAGDEELMPGLRRYRAPGLDVPTAVRALRSDRPAGRQTVCPNHVFLSSPFNQGGPFGPPAPTAAATLKTPAETDRVAVSIVDTGFWTDTPLPVDYLASDGVEVETETDVDNDGLLDGDVGHANFIGGVIANHTDRAVLRVVRTLDTFGVCTEDELIASLGRVHPDTKVINLSLGGYTADGTAPLGVQAALQQALSGLDRVVVAAAGNDGNRSDPFWPAAFAGAGESWSGQVVAVAAHDGVDLCSWSNAGSWVSLVAPGQDVRSTYIDHALFPEGWAQWSGTSFAAPRVAAEITARIDAQVGAVAATNQFMADVAAANQQFGGHLGLI
ncbi:S8 family peptidase [Salinispora arenicola]|uniref:Peptidase S8 and S53 subtilisin kexin sedolisin n=1 Tax=Salinispora arenicola (strain CNS-205) TaxID=391037 RepID=A8LVW0_SALAI|nr:S8/S53 family peptidase [Salinispora arenicola]